MGEGKRLGFLINQLKTNAFKFSKHANVSQGSISNIINGKRRMSREIIDKVAKSYPEVNLDWILRGIGSMFHELPKTAIDKVAEDPGDYSVIKSPIEIQEDGLPEEESLRSAIADNLRTTGKRWKLTQIEMMELLGSETGRQGSSTYFRGDTLPRLPVLLRLERLTGWPLVVLSTRVLEFDEIPLFPLVDAPLIPAQITPAEGEELKAELRRLKLRIARILDKME